MPILIKARAAILTFSWTRATIIEIERLQCLAKVSMEPDR